MVRVKITIFVLTVFFLIPFFVLSTQILPGKNWAGLSASAAVLGESQPFFVKDFYDFSGRRQISASLRLTGQNVQYFIEDRYFDSQTAAKQNEILMHLQNLAQEFDGRIYPLETALWGSEPNPGLDGDPRLTVVLTNLVSTAGGYFDTINEFPRSEVPESNAGEIIFLNIRFLDEEKRIASFLAHEFQHLISFNQKNILRRVNDDIWLNELRSEYTATYLGYNLPYETSNLKRRAADFLNDPTDSLTEWPNLSKDYGQAGLLGEYLAEHFGSGFLAAALRSSKTGLASINEALAAQQYTLDFGEIFLRWAVANAVNDVSMEATYGYFNENLRAEIKAPPTELVTRFFDQTKATLEHQFKDWQAKWFWFSGFAPGNNNFFQVEFSGPNRPFFRLAVVIFYQNGGKEVKFFDLEDPANVALQFDLKQDIEKIIFIPVKMEKISGFGAQEPLSSLTMNFQRIENASVNIPISTPSPTPSPTPAPVVLPKPSDFGLREGDFIRAEGDDDVYIINDFGYKRLILNPKICLQYGHLGKRGCFGAVKVVSPSVRDAFTTSWYFTNGETKDGKVYRLEMTGPDDGALRHLQMSDADFVSQGGNFKSVFLINTLEQSSYSSDQPVFKLP